MFEERLLGFDIRERGGEPDHLWDAERRAVFLLRVDAPKPLSVDTSVWPSVFDTGQGIGFPDPQRECLHLAGVQAPVYTGPNAGLWEDANHMQLYLHEHWDKPKPCVTIAISWASRSRFSNEGRFGPYLAQTSPAEIDPYWERLGFDVGDGSLVSGLSNCGYLPEEAQLLRPQWVTRLNETHLFDDPLHAFQFRNAAEERVPEHAPFFVYGLYLMEVSS
jgi:hypothetical protein